MWKKVKNFIYEHRYKLLLGVGVTALGLLTLNHFRGQNQVKLSAFINALKSDYIEEVIVQGQTVLFRSKNEEIWYQAFLGSFPLQQLNNLIQSKKIVFSNQEKILSKQAITAVFGFAMSLGTLAYMVREAKPETQNIDMKSKIYSNNHTFDDFYGGDLIKTKFRQIIDFLKNPQKYQKLGARIRRGVLFYGPPGTGKTMMARALANEANCQFIKVAASQFQQIFVGVGAKRVRQLFSQAKKCQNGCIIFVDQIDALGSRLNHLRDTHQTTSTINQFLSEMDGFSQLDKVIIVAATNRIDLVDAAILRAGRFDVKIQISLPCKQQRLGILATIMAKRLKNHEVSDQTLNFVGQKSEGWCGADLQALVNQSVYKAIKQNKQHVQSKHVIECLNEMIMRKL